MKFIKKLIVLTGKDGKGTLTLEQVSCGISYKLSTFNLVQAESRELLLIFGSEIYVAKVKDGKAQGVLSVVPLVPLHCAVMLGGKVEVYGADCQNRMPVFEIEQAYAVKKFGGKSCSSSSINPVVAFEQEGKNDVSKQINDGLVESEPCDKNTDEKDITRDGRVEIQNYFLEIVEPPSKVTESESIGCDSESELSSS